MKSRNKRSWLLLVISILVISITTFSFMEIEKDTQNKTSYFDCAYYDYYEYDFNERNTKVFLEDLYDSLFLYNRSINLKINNGGGNRSMAKLSKNDPTLKLVFQMAFDGPFFIPNAKGLSLSDSLFNFFLENGGYEPHDLYFDSLSQYQVIYLLGNDLNFLGTVVDKKDFYGIKDVCYAIPTSYVVKVDKLISSSSKKLAEGDLVLIKSSGGYSGSCSTDKSLNTQNPYLFQEEYNIGDPERFSVSSPDYHRRVWMNKFIRPDVYDDEPCPCFFLERQNPFVGQKELLTDAINFIKIMNP